MNTMPLKATSYLYSLIYCLSNTKIKSMRNFEVGATLNIGS
jgi:hypothetical protein